MITFEYCESLFQNKYMCVNLPGNIDRFSFGEPFVKHGHLGQNNHSGPPQLIKKTDQQEEPAHQEDSAVDHQEDELGAHHDGLGHQEDEDEHHDGNLAQLGRQ